MEVVAAIRIAKAGGRKLLEYRQRRLSEEEKELLVRAYEHNGEFQLFSTNDIPRWIRVGGKHYVDENHPEDYIYVEKYYGAFNSLCERGYVDHLGGTLFRLNYDGIQEAEKLVKKR